MILRFNLPADFPLEDREFTVVEKDENFTGSYYLSPVERVDLKCAKIGDELKLPGVVIKRVK